MLRTPLLVALLLSTPAFAADGDGDGYDDTVDCDDTDHTVYPGAAEICDGQINDCGSTALPNDERDDDGDNYVECEYDAATWAGDGSVVGGGDCDDSYDLTYPGATETCDGQYNDCDDPNYSTYGAPDEETDDDGDRFVECEMEASTWLGSGVIREGADCDDSDRRVYPGATEYCDGQYNDCDDASYSASGAPDDELDDDSDGYVECTVITTIWVGDSSVVGGDDCDDTYDATYPGATEICDSKYNDCDDSSYSASGAPDDEVDDDSDRYVECEYDPSIWLGRSTIIDGGDCDDYDSTRYPGAAEVCDGVYNDCDDPSFDYSSAPDDELDDDGDRYVECSYSSSTWQGDALVRDGDDCDDASDWGAYVYPGASEYCDGVFNDCEAPGYDASSAPDDELDEDGDGFVACDPNAGITWKNDSTNPNPYFSASAYSSSDPYHVVYADSAGTCFCPEVADAAGNDLTCAGSCVDAAGASCTPASGDCEAIGGYSDCLDTVADNGAYTHADAAEICDGQYNDCRDLSWDEGVAGTWPDRDDVDGSGVYVNVPDAERDDDGDGYVSCLEDEGMAFDSSLWLGYGSVSVTDGEDCDDLDSTVYSHAAEECDGVVNDCDHPQIAVYTAVVGTGCYCDDATGTTCVDSSDATCMPGSTDDLVVLSAAVTIGTATYSYVEAGYYCEASDCDIDPDADGYIDCASPDGTRAVSLSASAAAAACEQIETFVFSDHPDFSGLDIDGDGTVDIVSEEADLDEDGYVDCDGAGYSGSGWGGVGDEPLVGWDCYEGDASVYPAAPEICDGQRNDCDYFGTLPAEEEDPDGDGYVACDYDGSGWIGGDEPSVGWDCRPTDADSYPGAPESCNGVFDDCAAPDYAEGGAPAEESDNDGDGYVECYDGSTAWYGSPVPALGMDCDDTDRYVFLGAEEHCDGQYNDCGDSSFALDEIPDDEADLDGDGFVACIPSSSVPWSELSADPNPASLELIAYLDESGTCVCDAVTEDGACDGVCVTWAGAPCDPTDEDEDDFAACTLHSGFGDCDDATFEDHPGAEELCDARDNDCDEDIDEGMPDADGDGECDELDVEECDGQDNNGDGVIDEGCDTGSPAVDTGDGDGGGSDTGKGDDGAGCRGTGATWGLLLAPLLWMRRRRETAVRVG